MSDTEMRAEIRAETMDSFRTFADQLFAKKPALRSVLMLVAQYWNDEADDAVHDVIVASERTTPLWPHACGVYDDNVEPVAGEFCWSCWEDMGWMPFHDNSEAVIAAFEPYCHEDGSQDQSQEQNYLPYAIARRGETGTAIEIIGRVVRGHSEVRARAESAPPPLDERARELYLSACANADDGARRVLADHLLERGDPRGEYIALALAPELDAEGVDRRDALLVEHWSSWTHPLVAVVVEQSLRFERGLLAGVEVFAADGHAASTVRGALAWASIETLHYVPGSHDVLDPMMMSLREVAPIGSDGLEVLARSARPWAIETLHAVLRDDDDSALLGRAKLPRLRHLTLDKRHHTMLPIYGASWWSQLATLTYVVPLDDVHVYWQLTAGTELPCLAFADVGSYGRTTGWQIAWTNSRIEVRLLGFDEASTRTRLRDVLDRLPRGPVHLVATPLWQPTDDDITYLSRADRPVTRD